MEQTDCPLCPSPGSTLYHRDPYRSYLQCPDCKLVFVPPPYHLSPAAEKAEYDMHQNTSSDMGYRRFLGRLAEPLLARLQPGSQGLDFGSGPGPALSVIVEEAGHSVVLYDKYYAPDPAVWGQQYDFITASETVEHLARPGAELARLWAHVKPGGVLGLMTKLVLDQAAFAGWHYKNDRTHIAFFSSPTFVWLGRQWGVEPKFIGRDVILFEKNAGD
ncbi:MAG: methyltransferase domain-containing protein [Candidatus Latescibacteria bacterium]|nr:methyltransferase domain-containing protein [Candidatus Latescibacterota bacterium]